MKTAIQILTQQNQNFSKLILALQAKQELNLIFQQIVDVRLQGHCCLATIEAHILYVSVDNAAWATRLRYSIPELLKNLQTQPEFQMITTIRYFITPAISIATNDSAKTVQKVARSAEHEQLWQTTLNKLRQS